MSRGKILVTGASGFLARHLIEALIARGDAVTAIVRPGGSGLPGSFAGKVDSREWDLTDHNVPPVVFEGVTTVFHLASRYLPGGSAETLESLRCANVKPVANLVDASLRSGVRRFIHVSSVAACEFSAREVIADGEGSPVTAYGRSKLEGEELLRVVPPEKMAWTILRPTALYGEYGLGTMAEIVRGLARNRFAIFGDGSNAMNFSYAGNVTAAILKCEAMPATHGRTYILADGGLPLRDLTRMIREILALPGETLRLPVWAGYSLGAALDVVSCVTRRRMPLSVARVRAATMHRLFSAVNFKNDTGFEPPTPTRIALEKTVHWYLDQGAVA